MLLILALGAQSMYVSDLLLCFKFPINYNGVNIKLS